MQPFRMIALTPPFTADPAIAIAASRAGGIGILDLEYLKDDPSVFGSVAKLARYGKGEWGVKIDGGSEALLERAASDLPEGAKWVILTCGSPDLDSLSRQVQALRSRNRTVLLEVLSLEQALLGRDLKVDGLIAKGNESGGRVGEETAFILLQRILGRVSLPVWVQGGIGLHTAGACHTAGAAGVVLDLQLALTRESTLPESVKAAIGRMDGSETLYMGAEAGEPCRIYYRPGLSAGEDLRQFLGSLVQESRSPSETRAVWRRKVREKAGWGGAEEHVWLIGQDASFAPSLARRFHTVGGVLGAFREAAASHVRSARRLQPLKEDSPLAHAHGTRYPIVQGPMTRVSDVPAFAAAVAEGGGLPVLAVAMLRGDEVQAMLEETTKLLGRRSWGVGILGFMPDDLLREQLAEIRACPPGFAIIAGGRPDQARSLEEQGIQTYLHVPSPGLLKMFIENGARHFVFEGYECGGHVGPRSSFVLWNTMVDVLLENIPAGEMENCRVLFAGGVHDARSAAMVATLAAPLAERGGRVGVLMGTSYLFTEEAVSTGAILKGFQEEALRCQRTVLLESGPGHATRCSETPYSAEFMGLKYRLTAEKRSGEEVRTVLDDFNLGRLRIAAKGIVRHPRYGKEAGAPKYLTLSEEEQRSQGMYMIGQLAALRQGTCTIEGLHREIGHQGALWLENVREPDAEDRAFPARNVPSDVAVIGMGCLLPKAGSLQAYWENILGKVDAVTEVPEERFDWKLYFDPDPKARDKVYSKWGGFMDPVPFDPARYGMPPNTLSSIEPLQLLTLDVVRMALDDAGYADRPFSRERASVILGAGGGISDLGQQYAFRSNLPTFLNDVSPEVLSRLPEWTEDSFAGILMNVAAGRVANRFDLGGVNYTVDAACASSLAAIYLAVRELEAGTSDMVITGGVDTIQNPFGYLCFSKTRALSPQGRCRTFDDGADGIVISEGISMLVLKRLADAERDGDRIYAVIKAVGGSSDGRDKGLTAPRPEGQARALERAYAKAGFSPSTVELIEAHGTGTVAGDKAEVETLKRVFEAAGASPRSCAIGSVKSMIGHTKSTAGVAGMVKVAQALYHKILPPTLGVEKPNLNLAESPFYVNTDTRPWIHGDVDSPRRAGVSAFGFGGTNFHAVIEEYTGGYREADAVLSRWPSELFVWAEESPGEILAALEALHQALASGAGPELRDLAHTTWHHAKDRSGCRLALVATSLEDLRKKLRTAGDLLRKDPRRDIKDPGGIYYTDEPLAAEGKTAFLFPGQGSQYPDMLREMAVLFPEVRERFESADEALRERFPKLLSAYIFPPPRFSPEEDRESQRALMRTNVTQPALGAGGMGLLALLRSLGIDPDMAAGHSYGEYAALCAAGVFDEKTLYAVSEARGRFIIEAAREDLGSMAAVEAGGDTVEEILASAKEVWIANLNGPRQTIISGTRAGLEEAGRLFDQRGIRVRPIAVSCAFHSPAVTPARDLLSDFLSSLDVHPPRIGVFSNTTAEVHSQDPKEIIALLSDHLVRPVNFVGETEAMYRAGARIFIEVGPRNVLTALTQQILGDRRHVAVPLDIPGRPGLLQFQHALAQLIAHGVSVRLDRLYRGRKVRCLNLQSLAEETRDRPLSPTTWMVDGGKARPLRETGVRKPVMETPRVEKITERPSTDGKAPSPAVVAAPSLPPPARGVSPRPPVSSGSGDEAAHILLQHQQLMQKFLETQQQVMLAYLGGTAEGPLPLPEGAVPSLTQAMTAALPASPSPVSAAGSDGVIPETAVSEPAAAPEPKAEVDRQDLTRGLLQVVSERTGYPSDMLNLDLNMEADLGIDSIKRIEILGTLQRTYLSSGQGHVQVEEMSKIKTLGGIIDWICNAFSSRGDQKQKDRKEEKSSPATRVPLPAVETASPVETEGAAPRFLMEVVETPAAVEPFRAPADSCFLITDDEGGFAEAMAESIRREGGDAVLLRMGVGAAKTDEAHYEADLTRPETVSDLLALLRRERPRISGLVHLLPLKAAIPFERMDMPGWRQQVQQGVKSLFYLAKALGPDLREAAGGGGGYLIAATSMGGSFGMDRREVPFFPGDGAVAGLIKTIGLEWPEVRCKAVDLCGTEPVPDRVGYLLREMAGAGPELEVGCRESRRLIPRPRLSPLSLNEANALEFDPDWVILVTGGARGITAEAAIEIAKRHRPKLILAGRSPLPPEEEFPETAGLASPQDLKSALIERMRRSGNAASPTQVEAAYGRLMHEREMRNNLRAIAAAGARVQYRPLDVRDERALGSLIDEIYQSYGRLDGVIHGAGVIEDKLIEEKTPDSFDRVFDTKADSAFILSRKLRPDSLKFLVFFSSVAGRFGNRGQGDYGAANEVLTRMARDLDARWPGRVVAVDWGPWAKTGMVSEGVRRQFAERGVQLIPPSVGVRMLIDEIRFGRKGEAELVIGDGPWGKSPETSRECLSDPETPWPLLEGGRVTLRRNGTVERIKILDPRSDAYLRDHRIDGKPVFPMAMAVELMAEAAQELWPERKVAGIEGLRVLRGIVIENGSREIRITARKSETDVEVKISDSEKPERLHYRGTVHLTNGIPLSGADPAPEWPPLEPFPMTAEDAYRKWLFHGPRFQCISKIEGISERGIVALVNPSFPGNALSRTGAGCWLVDPIVIDSGPQLAILWARQYRDMTALPSGFRHFRQFEPFMEGPLRCYLRVLPDSEPSILHGDVFFIGPDGRLAAVIEGMEATCSGALNRVSGIPGGIGNKV